MLTEQVAQYLGWSYEEVFLLSVDAFRHYKKFDIPKKNGGRRRIFHPSKTVKSLQYAICDLFLSRLPVHPSAFAYVPKRPHPTLSNAEAHAPFRYSLRIDFEDFFPSIKSHDLLSAIPNELPDQDRKLLVNCLFGPPGENGVRCLPVGAPSSPLVSNIVMVNFDHEANLLASKFNGRYTRYADDVVFSTNTRGACHLFFHDLSSLVHVNISPKLTINSGKTLFLSRGCRRVVTGIVITPTGGTSVGRRQKRYLRKLLFELKAGRISGRDTDFLRGYLAFVKDVEPDLINRLTIKFGDRLLGVAMAPIRSEVA